MSMTLALDYGRRAERQRPEEPDVDPQVRFCERGRSRGRSLLDPRAPARGSRRREILLRAPEGRKKRLRNHRSYAAPRLGSNFVRAVANPGLTPEATFFRRSAAPRIQLL